MLVSYKIKIILNMSECLFHYYFELYFDILNVVDKEAMLGISLC